MYTPRLGDNGGSVIAISYLTSKAAVLGTFLIRPSSGMSTGQRFLFRALAPMSGEYKKN